MRFLWVLASLCLVTLSATELSAQTYRDADWNWRGEPNCTPPSRDSIRWMKQGDRRFLRFQLRDGEKGNCSTDQDAQHGAKFGKPWSERAEIKGRAFEQPGVYRISFDVRFVQGFAHQRKFATFFQIKDCPDSRVPAMIMLGGSTSRPKAGFSLATGTPGKKYSSRFVSPNPVDNRWHRVEAIFENGTTQALQVKFDGATWLPRTTFSNTFLCGKPSFRLGIYRAGDPGKRSHAIVDYDNVQVERIE